MDLLEDDGVGGNIPEFTVSELSGAVKRTLEGTFGRIRVRGEIGRVMRAASGHLYYDVKDERGVIGCTTWKGQVKGLGVMPEEGLEVIVTGKMSTFAPQSKYNLNVDSIEVAGEGALMMLLEKRKKALQAEGLFDETRKKKIPYLPEVIGVVTSLQGAVIRDILHRLRERFPRKVLIWPVVVQGENCAPQVTAAINGFNALTPGGALPRPDLIIVARGGGSIEDLWGFNEENVARAAAESQIPLISAVGHETDTTLIDFVSDIRAPTPTAAAEIAVPVRYDLLAGLDSLGGRMVGSVSVTLERRGQRLRDLARALPRKDELTGPASQRLDSVATRLPGALRAARQSKELMLQRAAAPLRPNLLKGQTERLSQRLENLSNRLDTALSANSDRARAKLGATSARMIPERLQHQVSGHGEKLKSTIVSLSRVAEAKNNARRAQLDRLSQMHRTLGYEATLERGYAVVWSGERVVKSKADAKAGITDIQFRDGRMKLTGTKAKAPVKSASQGSLFDD
ncbi:MAG: exodeoxyribonuclease VII large subunit [Litoreibacter sp.]